MVVATVATGCADEPVVTPVETTVDERAVLIADFRDSMMDVVRAQPGPEQPLAATIEAARGLDLVVSQLRDPETIFDARPAWAPADARAAAVDLEPVRGAVLALAFEVDDARTALDHLRRVISEDWERTYVDAEDDLLVQMRAYAEATDALAQILERHWRTYEAIRTVTTPFVEARWFYRNGLEAAGAYEIEVGDLIPALRLGQQEIAQFIAAREAAARAVNDAAAVAAAAWEARPDDDGAPREVVTVDEGEGVPAPEPTTAPAPEASDEPAADPTTDE